MHTAFFAMDTCFHHRDGRYTPKARAAMLKELGYAGTNATLWDDRAWSDMPELLAQLDAQGLALSGIYLTVDVSAGVIDPRLPGLLERLRGRGTLVELAMKGLGEYDKPSAPRADGRAGELINRVADLAGGQGLRLSLYPHCNFWLERLEDAVRVLMRVNRDDVGVTFNLFHWLYVDGEELTARLELALPRLCNVTVNGATRRGPRDCTIEPLDQGQQDLFAFLGTVARMGYVGPVSLQGFGVGGDVYANLRRSMAAWRDITGRVARHADWSRLDPPAGR
ncbi:MAG: TIM barrel protein [Planctomycetota bacterium]|nr:TIM barrel protein [Planctomycetota bacterium]